MGEAGVGRTLDALWRIEFPRIVATLTRMVRDVGLAEELAQEAFVTALDIWPVAGLPDRPGAWLMTTAKNRAIDRLRRSGLHDRKVSEVAAELRRSGAEDPLQVPEEVAVDDDLLRLIFMTCHPMLSVDARVALTLRLLGGLTTAEIARAYLVPEPTISQRIVRAKRTLSNSSAPFEVPGEDDLPERLGAVLEAIYLIFNEGYSPTSGTEWVRTALIEESLRLGRILAALTPDEPETQGLLSLMELQASRTRARTTPAGEPVLLEDQDRSSWDRLLITRGLAGLERALSLEAAPGPYTLQAAIAACHARALTAGATDWEEIATLYGALARLTPSPVVELNRAVAVARAYGPGSGLEIIDRLSDEGALSGYHLLPSVRGHLLEQLGRKDEARSEYLKAASMTTNARERTLLERKAQGTATSGPATPPS